MIKEELLLIKKSFWKHFIDPKRKDLKMSRLNSFRKLGINRNYNRRKLNLRNSSMNSENYKNGPNPIKINLKSHNK